MPCSNADKTQNQLKFAWVPQTGQPISAASRPKFNILWRHVVDILLLNKFFPIVDMCLSCEDIARQICTIVPRWPIFGDILGPAFSASRVQHVSDLHPKFALRPTMCGSMVDIQSGTAENRREKKIEERRRN